jgi:prolyl oligopeptidase
MSSSFLVLFPLVCLLMTVSCSRSSSLAGVPETRTSPVTDSYHSTEVVDDYRWLEDWDDPETQAWSSAQNELARSYLDQLPSVPEIRTRVTELMDLLPVRYNRLSWKAGRLFAIKTDPLMEQPILVVMSSPDHPEEERVVLDPNQIDSAGTTSIDWFQASPDGSLVAVSLSVGGSEIGNVHFYEVDNGTPTDVVIPRVNGGTAGGDLCWTADGSGVFYTRYPRPGERPEEDLHAFQQLWFHRLGSDGSDDHYEMGEDLPRIAEIEVDTDASGRVLASVQDGDSGRFAYFIRRSRGVWDQLAGFDDGVVDIALGPGDSLFLTSRKEAPRGKILRLDSTETPLTQATTIIEEDSDAIFSSFYRATTMLATSNRLYLIYQLGGPSEIRVFDHDGKPQVDPEILPVSAIGQNLVAIEGDGILFQNGSYIEPTSWYRFTADQARTSKTALAPVYPVDYSDSEVVRELAVSKDGTKIPLNIIRRKDIELDGDNPAMLIGYGGYNVSLTPAFSALTRIWIDQGGVFAVANLRGGGEFGEEWHRQGMLTNKQNVFDDFHACMRFLVERGYTSEEKLVIQGGSNGGLLMGAIIAQHPEAARTVISRVGIYDMLRVELSANGKFNIPEYGTVTNPEHFKALYAYSPYHNVNDGVSYPATLFMTGANDPRVDPMHSRKMTARLQAASSSSLPILLRTSSTTGHGGANPRSEQIEVAVDIYAFAFHQLGVEFKPAS